jgi:hypothetical protein
MIQLGWGNDETWRSIQGLRVSVDYRYVFAGDRQRNQPRLLA